MLVGTVAERRRMVIRGRVQGVGFRHFIWRRAGQLGLSGEVRNLPSGEVEVRASGDPGALDQLQSLAREGPAAAEVIEVRIEREEGDELPAGFRIRD
jgi:acylphosphatase